MNVDLTNARLYGIVDLGYIDIADASGTTELMTEGGVDLIQLRGKEQSVDELSALAAKMHRIVSDARLPLIVNDYVEVARRTEIEGVHVGQEDDSVATVREKAGRAILVGKSTHSLKQAGAAQKEGADYIGFGPIFATPTKPDYQPIGLTDIRQVHAEVSLPIFCIGGIKLQNLEQVIAAGAQRVVIVSGLLKAADIIEYAREARRLLNSSFVIRHP